MIWVTSGMRGPTRYWHRGKLPGMVSDPILGSAMGRRGGEIRGVPSAVYAGARVGGFAGVLVSEREVPPSSVFAEGALDRRRLCLTCVELDHEVQ